MNKVAGLLRERQEARAAKDFARSDAARAAYYKSISGREWGDPHGYELCVDSSIGAEAAASLICEYMRHRG